MRRTYTFGPGILNAPIAAPVLVNLPRSATETALETVFGMRLQALPGLPENVILSISPRNFGPSVVQAFVFTDTGTVEIPLDESAQRVFRQLEQ